MTTIDEAKARRDAARAALEEAIRFDKPLESIRPLIDTFAAAERELALAELRGEQSAVRTSTTEHMIRCLLSIDATQTLEIGPNSAQELLDGIDRLRFTLRHEHGELLRQVGRVQDQEIENAELRADRDGLAGKVLKAGMMMGEQEARIAELEAWKQSAMAVDAEWEPLREFAKRHGARIGHSMAKEACRLVAELEADLAGSEMLREQASRHRDEWTQKAFSAKDKIHELETKLAAQRKKMERTPITSTDKCGARSPSGRICTMTPGHKTRHQDDVESWIDGI